MLPWSLVESYCGSAALTLHLLGAKRRLVPYRGSKWHVRTALEGLIRETTGVEGPPRHVLLFDAIPWASTLYVALCRRPELLPILDNIVEQGEKDPAATAKRLASEPLRVLSTESATYRQDQLYTAAAHLWLQRMAFRGKSVGVAGNRWVWPGLSKTSAYGEPSTDKFGEVKPQGRSLLRAVASLPEVPDDLFHWGPQLAVIYLDPPYKGTTGYAGTSPPETRENVVAKALCHRSRGHDVFVSEAEPIEELEAHGWSSACLFRGRGGDSPFNSNKAEWVTYSAGRP